MKFKLSLLLMLPTLLCAQPRYFLCGPDEDGCFPAEYPYCLCIAYDPKFAEHPYCLDFNTVQCIPLLKKPNCPVTDIFKNESDCVATAYQSEPDPSCPLVTEQFCQMHHITLESGSTVNSPRLV